MADTPCLSLRLPTGNEVGAIPPDSSPVSRLQLPVDPSQGLRVLHYTTWKTACGIAGYTESLINSLTAQGVSNTVRVIDRQGLHYMSCEEKRQEMDELCRQARDYDVVHVQHEFGFFNPPFDVWGANRNFFRALRQLVRQETPTVITFHTEPCFPTEPLGLRAFLRHLLNGRVPWHGWTFRRAIRGRTDLVRVIVHNRSTRAAFINVGVPAEIITVLPIGFPEVRSAQCALSSTSAKKRLGFPSDCTLLSLFGFVSRYKGHEVAAKALQNLPPNFCLAVVGGAHPEGKETTINTLLRIRKNMDPRRLVVTGYVTPAELDLYHAATDICLAPYIDDTLSSSVAITWAMTSGKPVIASNIRAFREINASAECLLMVTPNAEMELAWLIERLASSPALQARLVANAQRYAREHSWPETALRTAALYEDLLRRENASFWPGRNADKKRVSAGPLAVFSWARRAGMGPRTSLSRDPKGSVGPTRSPSGRG
jgi:glycosyltransferase involved in cell wall biosynthesis